MTKKSLLNNIIAGVTMAEGVCAAAVVDGALKNVAMNKVIKCVGRYAVSALIYTPFMTAAYMLIEDGKEDEKKNKRYSVSYMNIGNGNIKEYYKAGDRVELDASSYLSEDEKFSHWVASDNVTLDDPNSPITSFIMPAENVKMEFILQPDTKGEDDGEEDEDVPESIKRLRRKYGTGENLEESTN